MAGDYYKKDGSKKEKKDRYVLKNRIGYVNIDEDGEFYYTREPELILSLEDAKKLNKVVKGTILFYGHF
jgi:hypothetical protein